MAEFTLYTFSFPSRAERISWCLNELALDYEVVKLNPFKGEIFTHEGFKETSPLKKMPALVHHRSDGDKHMYESLAICVYKYIMIHVIVCNSFFFREDKKLKRLVKVVML